MYIATEVAMRALTRSEQSELNDLAWHWEEAYRVHFDGDVLVADRIGEPAHVFTAETADELRELLREDYAEW
jgi:hypothetical protein